MGNTKSKALALELMDDLLDDAKEGTSKTKDATALSSDKTAIPLEPTAAEPLENNETARTNQHTVAASAEVNDRTVRLKEPTSTSHSASAEDRVRASVGRFAPLRNSGPPSNTEAALAQSESLRIAQTRILELEQENERLRLQNEELAAAGETLRHRADELLAQTQKRESDHEHAMNRFVEEKEILNTSREAARRESEALKRKVEELDLRMTSQIQKVRVRERELENRLELVKMENAALIRSKDEMILDLKRQMDQLNMELSNYRNKNQELNRLAGDKQEMLRRTVKALRLALSMLEGEEEASPAPVRKAK